MARIAPALASTAVLTLLAVPERAALPDGGEPELLAATWRACGLQHSGGELVGGGPGFRVRFRPQGFELTPAFGAAAPRSYPLAFELEAIRRGAVVLAGGGEVEPQEEGLVARYVRAGGIVEAYEVGLEGIEQTFLFPSRPPGEGDLVVRGRISTDLVPSLDGDPEAGLAFVAPGLGGVRYGGVVGIDAQGRSQRGHVRLDGDTIELVLPERFVEVAAYPLLLDPLIGPLFEIPSGENIRQPAAAYDATTGIWLVAAEVVLAANDVDIRAYRITDAGTTLTISFLESGDGVATNPCVANVNLTDRFFVAWQWQSDPGAVVSRIEGRSVPAAGGSASPTVVLAAFGAYPACGGEATLEDDEVIVVWQHTTGIFGAQVTVPSSGTPVPFGTFQISSDLNDGLPSISRSGGPLGRYLVTWSRFFATPSPGDSDVYARAIDRNGGFLTPVTPLPFAIGPHETWPSVDGDGHKWMVVHEWRPSLVASEGSVFCVSVELPFLGGTSLLFGEPKAVDPPPPGVLQARPSIGFAFDAWVVAWGETHPSGTDLMVRTLKKGTCDLCEGMAIDAGTDGLPEVATKRSGAITDADEALIVWETVVVPGQSDVKGTFWETEVTEATSLGGGCGSGGTAQASCAFAGNPYFHHRLSGAAPLKPAFLVLAFDRLDAACGSCTIVPDPFTGFVAAATTTDAAGKAGISMPIPDDPALLGLTFFEQWAVADDTPSCPAFGVDLSNALLVQIL